jgi:hypothetical protein
MMRWFFASLDPVNESQGSLSRMFLRGCAGGESAQVLETECVVSGRRFHGDGPITWSDVRASLHRRLSCKFLIEGI